MKKNNKKGFTLVELVIVVAVMAVLVAVAIPTVKSVVGTAEDAVANTNARTIESQIKLELADKISKKGSAAVLTATDIDTALTNAQLGIDGCYVYNSGAGTVTPGELTELPAASTVDKGTYVILFNSKAATNDALVQIVEGAK